MKMRSGTSELQFNSHDRLNISLKIDWLIEAYSPGFCTKRLKLGLEQWP